LTTPRRSFSRPAFTAWQALMATVPDGGSAHFQGKSSSTRRDSRVG
jgi:hypothetical protein